MIRILLLLYPRAWRQRYGDEVAELVRAEGLRPGDVVDIARASIRERLRAASRAFRGGTPMRHPTAWAMAGLVLLLPTAAFVAGSLAAYQLGVAALRGPMDRVAASVGAVPALDLLLATAPLVAILLAALPLVRPGPAPDGSQAAAVIHLRVRRANVAVIGLALALGAVLAWYVAGELVRPTW